MKKIKGRHIKSEKAEFSKILMVQDSILIWLFTIAMVVLAYICVFNGYFGELPWLTAMVACPWAAYAIDQKAYYTKSQAQNTKGGITYETAMSEYAMNYNPSTFDDSAVG